MATNNKIRKTRGEIVFAIFNYTIMLLFTLACIYPFYFILINTISDNKLVMDTKVLLIPRGIHFENYKNVLKMEGMGHATLVSLARTIIGTAGTAFCTAYLGYFFTKRQMWGYRFWYRFLIVTMYFNAGLIPYYMAIRMLGMLDTFAIYVVPGLVSVYNMVLVKTYIESIGISLEESAEIDGAGYLRRFFSIIVPLSVPILATIVLFTTINQWSAFTDTLIYCKSPKLDTLQFMLYRKLNEVQALTEQLKNGTIDISAAEDSLSRELNEQAVRYTVTAIVTLPILCVYPFIQRYYVKGVMIGAIKG